MKQKPGSQDGILMHLYPSESSLVRSTTSPGIDRLLAGHSPGIETLRAIPNWKLTKVEVKRFSSSHLSKRSNDHA